MSFFLHEQYSLGSIEFHCFGRINAEAEAAEASAWMAKAWRAPPAWTSTGSGSRCRKGPWWHLGRGFASWVAWVYLTNTSATKNGFGSDRTGLQHFAAYMLQNAFVPWPSRACRFISRSQPALYSTTMLE